MGPHPLVLGPFILPGHQGKVCAFVPGKERQMTGHSLYFKKNSNEVVANQEGIDASNELYGSWNLYEKKNKVVCPLPIKISESVLG